MATKQSVLIVIPARFGSKGVPRKNIRLLGGIPLIAHTIRTANKVKEELPNFIKVVVSTDSDEMANIASEHNAEIHMRPKNLSGDSITLDPVIKSVEEFYLKDNISFNIIITLQPTCPFIKVCDVKKAISAFDNKKINSIISVVEDKHLRWKKTKLGFQKDYTKRLNRQSLPDIYKETGGIIGVRSKLFKNTRIVEPIEPIFLDYISSIDIDTPIDFMIAESIMLRKKIALWPIGIHEKGMGHVYRTIILADSLVSHEVSFVMTSDGNEGKNIVQKNNYPIKILKNKDMVANYLIKNNFDMVILDILDTDAELIKYLKKNKIKTVSFEDLGSGSNYTDLTINALYNKKSPSKNTIKFGPKYFLLRQEFFLIKKQKDRKKFTDITIIFGGSDPNNLTLKTLKEIHSIFDAYKVSIIIGPAYKKIKMLKKYIEEKNLNETIDLIVNTKKISKYINRSKFVICSGGQTLYESLSLGVPAIVISQNKRELTHGLLEANFMGLINLGHHKDLKRGDISRSINYLSNKNNYREIEKYAKKIDLSQGNKIILNELEKILKN